MEVLRKERSYSLVRWHFYITRTIGLTINTVVADS